jgi:hypothetical protein
LRLAATSADASVLVRRKAGNKGKEVRLDEDGDGQREGGMKWNKGRE